MSEKICPQCGKDYPADQRFCPTDGTPLRPKSATADLVGQVIAERFHVLSTLGEGGMGRVYLAEHVRMGRKCALKVMSPRMASDAEAITRFNREAANACKINHPNVAAVYDFGETSDGLIYLAMEYVEGVPLTKLIETQPNGLPPVRAANITKQVADALGAAHELGIVHRDLKPDNVMIAKGKDGADVVKVVDFGIAKAGDNDAQKVTKTGLVVGTPEYMSPEQLSGDKVEAQSDIYALALVSFNMLTGKLPFPADSQQEAMIMRLTDRPRRLDEVAPDRGWTPEVQAVLDRALERDPKNRYQSASEMGRDFALAADWLPETQAANAGTLVMDAPIASSSGPSSGTDATAVLPRTSVSERNRTTAIPESTRPPVRLPEQKRGMPAWAIAAVAAVVIGGGAFALKLGGGAGVTQAGAPQSTSDTTSSRLDSSSQAVTTGAADSLGLENTLARLERLTNPDLGADSITASRALTTLDSLESAITSGPVHFHARLVRAEALMLVNRRTSGCDVLDQLKKSDPADRRMKRVDQLVASLCSRNQ